MRKYAPLIGAAIAVVIGAALMYGSIEYAENGCDCNKTIFRDWLWIPMMVLAAAFIIVAIALAARFIAGRRPRFR
jgi:hypothetical protein